MDMAIVWVPSACPSPGVLLAQHTPALSFWCCMKQMVLSLACSGLESTLEQLEVGLNEAGNRLQAEDLCLARKDPSLLGAGRVRSGLPLPSSCPKKNLIPIPHLPTVLVWKLILPGHDLETENGAESPNLAF